MAAKTAKRVTPELSKLKKAVSSLAEKASSLDMHEIRKELEEKIISSENIDIVDNAIVEVIDKYFVDFSQLSKTIIKLLNDLKAKSKDHYIEGFKIAYYAISHLTYDSRFNTETSVYTTAFERRAKDPAFACILALGDRIGEKIIKPLNEELLVNRTKDFDLAFDMPESFSDLTEYIVKALYETELILNGKIKKMEYYNIPIALEKFNSLRFKYENNPKKSFILFQKFHDAIYTLDKEIEASQLDEEIYKDGGLESMWNDMTSSLGIIESMFTEEELASMEPEEESILEMLQSPIQEKNVTEKESSVNDFFEKINKGTITKIEIFNITSKLTDNFDLKKLQLLEDDFSFYFSMARGERQAQVTDEEIFNEIDRLKKENKPIPYLKVPDMELSKANGKVTYVQSDAIDIAKLLYPYDFFFCYSYHNFLKDEIKQRLEPESKQEIAKGSQHLKAQKNKDTFASLISEKKAAFILKMLEDLGITTNGKANVSQRKKGSIRGVAIAAKDNGILPSRSIPSLCKLIAAEIGLDLKKVGPSDESREYERKARAYIKSNYTT